LGQWASGLFPPTNDITFSDLATTVPDFLANVTVSLISSNIDPSQFTNVTSNMIVHTSVPATSTSYPVVYSYDIPTLLEVYVCALGIVTVCVVVGI